MNAMAFIPFTDCVLAELRMSLFGQQVENTLGFRKDGGWSLADATDLANKLLLWWTTYYAVFTSQDCTLRELYITDLSSASGFAYTQAAPTPNPEGDVAEASLPSNVTLCVSLRTTSRGRSFRGRNYIAGIPDPAVVANVYNPTYRGFVLAAYAALISDFAGFGYDLVVLSRRTGNAPRVTGVATAVTAATIVDTFVDSQRRRLTGRGN